jgi:hypothetical protein
MCLRIELERNGFLMRKVAVVALILIILNFICCNYTFADTSFDISGTFTESDYKSISEKGITDIDGTTVNVDVTDSTAGSATGMGSAIGTGFCYTISKLMTNTVIEGGLYHTDSEYSTYNKGVFSICSLIFGEYLLFDGKIYQTTASLNEDVTSTGVISQMDDIKETCATWYKVISSLGASFSLFLFIYALIRMALSTTGDDLARWKKVMGQWFLCLVLLFLGYWVLIALNGINDAIMDSLWSIKNSLEENNYSSFEIELFTASKANIQNSAGDVAFAYTLEFAAMIIFQIMFFVKYALRALGLIILFLFSPIFILIHAVRVMTGGDETTLKSFLQNYVSLLFMQPLHALIYLIFMFTASEIMLKAPLLGIVFLYALYRAEKIIKIMLDLNTGFSLKSLIGKN